MKIYLIKHKGKTWWGNLIGLCGRMSIGDYDCHIIHTFFFKRDAIKYLNTFKNKENFEITSAEVKESKQDNRKRFN